MQTFNGLDLWDRVYKTDKSQTKSFTRSGGFRGTSIAPLELVRRATEIFGPLGSGWGIEQTGPAEVANMPNGDILVNLKVRIWYNSPSPASKVAWVEGWGGTVLYDAKRGFTDDEAYKKSYTDAVGTALSRLGFGADIRLGFNEDKYTSESSNTTSPAPAARPPQQQAPAMNLDERFNAAKTRIEEAGSTTDLAAINRRIEEIQFAPEQLAELESLIRTRATELRENAEVTN